MATTKLSDEQLAKWRRMEKRRGITWHEMKLADDGKWILGLDQFGEWVNADSVKYVAARLTERPLCPVETQL